MTELYSIINKKADLEEHKLVVKIGLNVEHNIFKGHFPSQPVLPGVCQVEIVGEILSKEINSNLRLISANNIKYLKMVDPQIDEVLDLNINFEYEDESIKVNAVMKSKEEVCMKAKLKYTIL